MHIQRHYNVCVLQIMISTGRKVQFHLVRVPCLSKYLDGQVSVSYTVKKGVSQPIFPHNLPLVMTLPSAHHSPNTVNRKAKEFVIGTVRLNSVNPQTLTHFPSKLRVCLCLSVHRSSITPSQVPYILRAKTNIKLTSLSNQQKEPHTPRNIKQERDCVGGPSQ